MSACGLRGSAVAWWGALPHGAYSSARRLVRLTGHVWPPKIAGFP